MYLFIFDTSGFVALVVGGNDHKEVELYSPEGNCQHNLAPIPVPGSQSHEPVLAYIDEKILACAGYKPNKNCYIYHPNNDSWSIYSTSTFTHESQPGEIYNDKIYIKDDSNPEVFDPIINSWSSWPAPLNKTGEGPCLTRVFAIDHDAKNVIEEFHYNNNTWSSVEAKLIVPRKHHGTIALPAELFQHLPGGCVGVQ
jgi:hypothetical protein